MAAHSENDYLQLYRDSFTKSQNVEMLVTVFKNAGTLFSGTILAKMQVVTQEEWRCIEQSSKGRISEKREKQARNLIGKVMEKDTLKAYRGFRGFAEREAKNSGQLEVMSQVFPFAADEDMAGLAPKLKTVPKGKA